MKNLEKYELALVKLCKLNDLEYSKLEDWYKENYLMENCLEVDLIQVIYPIFFKIWVNRGVREDFLLEVICKPYLGDFFSMSSFGYPNGTNWETKMDGKEWSKEFINSMCRSIRNTEVKCIPGYVEYLEAN